jgi:hypothetical protein
MIKRKSNPCRTDRRHHACFRRSSS